jgi:hypothetical protein
VETGFPLGNRVAPSAQGNSSATDRLKGLRQQIHWQRDRIRARADEERLAGCNRIPSLAILQQVLPYISI